MKKILITLVFSLALLLVLPINAFADGGKYVVDNGNLLTSEEESALEEKLEAIEEKYNFDVVALTIPEGTVTSESDAEAYADDYYDYNGYKDDGCLLLISEDHYWHISTKGFGITAITDYGIEVLREDVIRPYFGSENWSGGFNAYADLIDSYVEQAKSGNPYDVDNTYTNESGYTYSESSFEDSDDDDATVGSFIIALIVGIVIAAIITGMVKSGYKPVRFKANAQDYLVDGSLNVTSEYDRFLYSNVTKTKIEKSSSSGGSSTHTSSSGSSHGGGGGRF